MIRPEIKKKLYNGFTLIELLVVMSILSLMASITSASMNGTRASARDSHRLQNLVQLRTALELYHAINGQYPMTYQPGAPIVRFMECGVIVGQPNHPNDYIPGIVPNYVAKLPSDPKLDCMGPTHSWSYASDGRQYKLSTHPETRKTDRVFTDPSVDGGPNDCLVDGPLQYHISVWSPADTPLRCIDL
jgi:prepilin-type N-terminal cleavage/methylation domain-containing protein